MKVSYKNSLLMMGIAFINFTFAGILALIRSQGISIEPAVRLVFSPITDVTFIISMLYVAALIKYCNEERNLILWFNAFVAVNILIAIISYIPADHGSCVISRTIGIIASLISLCIIVVCFNIKNSLLRLPFRVYAFTYVFILIIDFGVPVLLPLAVGFGNYFLAVRYMGFAHILPILAMLYIFLRSCYFFTDRL